MFSSCYLWFCKVLVLLMFFVVLLSSRHALSLLGSPDVNIDSLGSLNVLPSSVEFSLCSHSACWVLHVLPVYFGFSSMCLLLLSLFFLCGLGSTCSP